jgi:hypothetical protein
MREFGAIIVLVFSVPPCLRERIKILIEKIEKGSLNQNANRILSQRHRGTKEVKINQYVSLQLYRYSLCLRASEQAKPGLILSCHNSSTVDGYRDWFFVAVQFWVEGEKVKRGGQVVVESQGNFFISELGGCCTLCISDDLAIFNTSSKIFIGLTGRIKHG